MDILVNVVNQKLKIATNLKSLVAGTQNFIRLVFNLTSDWDGLTTFAQFRQGNRSYNQYLDDEKSAYLPSEIGVGTCTVLLYGTGNRKRATTNYLTLTIDENLFVSNASSTDISTSLYEQLIERVAGIEADNGDAFQRLADTDATIQTRINTIVTDALGGNPSARVATSAELTAEHDRAVGEEAALSNRITEIGNNLTDLINDEEVSTIINSAVEREMQQYLNSGALVAMTIPNKSITSAKLSDELTQSLAQRFDSLGQNLTSYVNSTNRSIGALDEQDFMIMRSIAGNGDMSSTYSTINELAGGAGLIGEGGVIDQKIDALSAEGGAIETALMNYHNVAIIGEDGVITSVNENITNLQYMIQFLEDKIIKVVTVLPAVVTTLPNPGEEGRDYYLKNGITDTYTHYKYTSGQYQKMSITDNLENILCCLKTNNGAYMLYLYLKDNSNNYAWRLLSGSKVDIRPLENGVSASLPESGDEFTDYYIERSYGRFAHYRYYDGAFHEVGVSDELNTVIGNLRDSLQSQINTNTQNILSVTQSLNNLTDTVNNLDTEGHVYDVDYRDNTFYFYEGEADETNEPLKSFTITGGGGGGGGAQTTTLTIRRITESPYIRTLQDDVIIRFEFESTDGDGETVDGNYTWRVDNRVVKTGTLTQGENTFDAKSYFGNIAGTHKLTLSVTDTAGSSATKSWTVQVVDLRIRSDFDDGISRPAGQKVLFSYTPYGAVTKKVHFVLDGIELGTVTNTYSGTTQYYELPAKPHGAHLLECYITATINDIYVESNHIYKDIVWFDENASTPVIGCIYRNNYYHVVEKPTGEYLNDYYTLNNGTYTKASYKIVDNPIDDDIGTYYELHNTTYTLTSDTSVNGSKTYYVKQVTDGITYYSKSVYASQYDTTSIPYYVFSPATSMPTVTQTADGKTTTIQMDKAGDIWRYMSDAVGKHNLVIACGSTSVTISMGITTVNINVTPVDTELLGFDFNPVGYSNLSNNRLWVDASNPSVSMTVSNNFNWYTGGYQTDDDGTPCFCVKAGTTATFSYPLFQNYNASDGMEFKIIFKTTNVGNTSARFLECLSNGRGLEMNVHEAYLRTSVNSLYVPYSEEDKIELEFNVESLDVNDSSAQSFIMSYEDGVAFRPMILSNGHSLQQSSVITVGSQDCDVYIYRMKAYTTALTDAQILSNFIIDAPNALEMIARYNRNQIYDENGILTPESVANACPDLKVIKIDCPTFTTDKSTFIKNTTIDCIHLGGRSVEDNWRFENCYHSGQGTTSDQYGDSARNIDILCNCDGITSPYPGKIDKNGVDKSYITKLTLGNGTVINGCKYEERSVATGASVAGLYYIDKEHNNAYVRLELGAVAESGTTYYERVTNDACKVNLSDTSVPNNWFNIKVNVASSENANNALLQKRYNDYLPYRAKARDRYDRYIVKNDMEFFNCVVFIRENDVANAKEFKDGQWHFYAIGNIGDSKKTDYTRANNPSDMREFAVEINDNSGLNQPFTTGVYATYTAVASPSTSQINTYYERDGLLYTKTEDTTVETGKTYYTRGSLSYNPKDGAIERTPVFPITKAQWNNANNQAKTALEISFVEDKTRNIKPQFEFRYDLGGMSKDGVSGDTTAEQQAQRDLNEQIFKDFYIWVVTSTDQEFKEQLSGWFIEASALYWYLFTERYTMMDNRAKNSFWHFANTGEYRKVPVPSSACIDYYYEATHYDTTGKPDNFAPTSDTEIVSGKTYYWTYAFELWCYDTDSALGTDNNGIIKIPYGREDTDFYDHDDPGTGAVFNAADSTFWRRIRLLKQSELIDMYQEMESKHCTSADSLINEFDTWQSQFPEELWRLDIERKYYRPFFGSDGTGVEVARNADPKYLRGMMNGRKKYQRRQFERDNEAYFATKYHSSSAKGSALVFRPASTVGDNPVVAANYNLQVTPFSDMYLFLDAGEVGEVSVRARAGRSYVLKLDSSHFSRAQDTQFLLYWAPRIQELSDLSAAYLNELNCSSATKLKRLVVGNSTTGYKNAHLESMGLTIGNLPLLEYLDLRNITKLTGELILSGCPSIKKIYAQGTKYTGFSFAPYGRLDEAHLPDTTTSLTLDNLHYITDNKFYVSYDNLTKLYIRECSLDDRVIISDSYDTLTELRAYGIDWNLGDVSMLNALLEIDSVLTGTLTINGAVGSQELLKYRNKWKDLQITVTGTVIPQVLCTYYSDNTENRTELCSVWIQSGDTPPSLNELISMEYLEGTPTRATDERYVYTFRDWRIQGSAYDGLGIVYYDTDIYAMYDTELRNYTVQWCAKEPTGFGDTIFLVKTDAHYGDEVSYEEEWLRQNTPVEEEPTSSDDPEIVEEEDLEEEDLEEVEVEPLTPPIPEDHSLDSRGIFRIFAGWDKCTAHIIGDTNVIALWEQGAPPDTKQYKNSRDLLHEMTVGEINAVAQTDQVDDYFDPADTVDIILGHDFNFTNVESDVIVGEGSILNLNDKLRLRGNTTYDTGIKLFDEDAPSFTLAVDYRIVSTLAEGLDGATLFSCYEENGAEGFSVGQYNSNTPRLLWGDVNCNIGAVYGRDIVVLRHIKGSSTLYVYDSYGTSVAVHELTRTRVTSADSTLVFGGITIAEDGSSSRYLHGIIYWSKIWYEDIGDSNARQLAIWPHELLRMNFIDKNRYTLADNPSKTTNMSFIANNLLERSYPYHNTSNDTLVYRDTFIRSFLNDRFLNALPTVWSSLIKKVTLVGGDYGNSQNLLYWNDKVYLPAAIEILPKNGSNQITRHPQVDEGKPISYFFNNTKGTSSSSTSGSSTSLSALTERPSFTIKHLGLPDEENAHYYTGNNDPKIANTVNASDWWSNAKYEPDEWEEEHPNFSGMRAYNGGVWVNNTSFLTRTHSLNGTYYKPIQSDQTISGGLVTSSSSSRGWSSSTPLCPCFSI